MLLTYKTEFVLFAGVFIVLQLHFVLSFFWDIIL